MLFAHFPETAKLCPHTQNCSPILRLYDSWLSEEVSFAFGPSKRNLDFWPILLCCVCIPIQNGWSTICPQTLQRGSLPSAEVCWAVPPKTEARNLKIKCWEIRTSVFWHDEREWWDVHWLRLPCCRYGSRNIPATALITLNCRAVRRTLNVAPLPSKGYVSMSSDMRPAKIIKIWSIWKQQAAGWSGMGSTETGTWWLWGWFERCRAELLVDTCNERKMVIMTGMELVLWVRIHFLASISGDQQISSKAEVHMSIDAAMPDGAVSKNDLHKFLMYMDDPWKLIRPDSTGNQKGGCEWHGFDEGSTRWTGKQGFGTFGVSYCERDWYVLFSHVIN